jgi:hypothetical protein
MARQNDGVNKSEEIRQLLKENPNIGSKEAVSMLAEKGVKISNALFYFVKGHSKGRKARKQRAENAVVTISEFRRVDRSDAVKTILKVKAWAQEVGGMSNLRALVEAMSD